MPAQSTLSVPETPAAARPVLPLQGLTILAVEDSRFASEALRLLCQRSGARLRRADTLQAAARHLAVYRPDVVIVDLGLPDGDGADLIRALAVRGPVVLGTSGDPDGRAVAMAAGAAGYLDKPPENLGEFQAAILHHLPGQGAAERADTGWPIRPDPLALHDDLARAAALLSQGADAQTQAYVAGFLGSIARSARDTALAGAANAARVPAGRRQLEALLTDRLGQMDAAFPRSGG
jgi:DNA-binding response OmpR family regulator